LMFLLKRSGCSSRIHSWVFYSVPLVFMSVFVLRPTICDCTIS
jgi:hypothetical protein